MFASVPVAASSRVLSRLAVVRARAARMTTITTTTIEGTITGPARCG